MANKKIEKNKLTGEEKAWKMLEKMGWKGKGRIKIIFLNRIKKI